MKRESSKYVYIRESSLEWNEPAITCTSGACLGIDPCLFDVQDHVRVVYFDDPMLQRLTNTTRTCNECRTCLFGGRGERIQISAPCCCGLAYRATCPCPCMCVPVCCPTALFPCTMRHEIYLEDANQGIYALQAAIRSAQENPLYVDATDSAAAKLVGLLSGPVAVGGGLATAGAPEVEEMNRA